MDKLVYVGLLLTFLSCDNLKEIQRDGIAYHFTDNISEARSEVLCDYISDEISDSKFETLSRVTTVKVDSVPFSIVLYIPYSDSITSEVKNGFRAFANMLTYFSLDSVPVNVVLTDDKFKGIENIPFDKQAVTWGDEIMTKGRVEIKSTPNASRFSKEILNEILRNKMPELYKGDDSVKISLDVVRDTVMVDFNIDPKSNNLDTLRSQFKKTDMLFFHFTFDRKTILFHVRDKGTKELLTVFGVRGE